VKKRQIIFLCGLPRAGNTLLGSLINENKKIKATPNSIIPEILYQLNELKDSSVFQNFPDFRSLDNVSKMVIDNYYKEWKADVILDRGPWGTPYNLRVIKQFIPKPKFVVLFRPLIECLASFAKLKIDNGFNTKEDIREYIDELMDEEGMIGKSILSIKNLCKEKEDYKIFYYNDLVEDTDNFLKNLSSFIGFKINNYNRLKQFNVNNTYYQDTMKNLHRIRVKKIQRQTYDINDYLPEDIIEKYSGYKII
jgi:hypothetical protein